MLSQHALDQETSDWMDVIRHEAYADDSSVTSESDSEQLEGSSVDGRASRSKGLLSKDPMFCHVLEDSRV